MEFLKVTVSFQIGQNFSSEYVHKTNLSQKQVHLEEIGKNLQKISWVDIFRFLENVYNLPNFQALIP